MHALEWLAVDFKISKYELAKRSEISTGTLNNMIYRNIAVDDIKVGTIIKLANGVELMMDEVYARLKSYEKRETKQQ